MIEQKAADLLWRLAKAVRAKWDLTSLEERRTTFIDKETNPIEAILFKLGFRCENKIWALGDYLFSDKILDKILEIATDEELAQLKRASEKTSLKRKLSDDYDENSLDSRIEKEYDKCLRFTVSC